MSLYMESMKYCPVGRNVADDSFNYCPNPEHEGVLLVRVYSYEPGKITTPRAGSYDIEHDNFGLDQGVSKARILWDSQPKRVQDMLTREGITAEQFYEAVKAKCGERTAHPSPTEAHEDPPASTPEPKVAHVAPSSSGYTSVKSYIVKVQEADDQPKPYSIRIKEAPDK